MKTLLTRDEFRQSVFKRDEYKCVMCQNKADAAHHILERRLWENEGYYLDNGASLCPICHIKAETTEISCDELRHKAGITQVLLPNDLYKSEKYDKWGNVIMPNGLRLRGELFFDESVQKILAQGNMLGQFTKYVKFPKINHLPWSESVNKDDRMMQYDDVIKNFEGQEIIVSAKLDGENTSLYADYMHARSIDGRNHPSRNWLKNFHAQIRFDIPKDWRICGENVFAKHSIEYDELPSYFMVFCIYNEKNICLGWDETVEYCKLIGLEHVPLLYRGAYDEEAIKKCYTGRSTFGNSEQEGYVMRLARSIKWGEHRKSFVKFVRNNHVQTNHNWMMQAVVKNKLRE